MSLYWAPKLDKIVGLFPSLSSRVATLKTDLLLLYAIILWMPRRSTREFLFRKLLYDICERIELVMNRIRDAECSPSTPEATMDYLLTDCMLNFEDIKPATRQLLAIHLEIEYDSDDSKLSQYGVSDFVDYLTKVQMDSNEEAVTSIHNLKAYRDLSDHLTKVCERKEALVKEIWKRARDVADHTAMFMYSCLYEQDTDLNLNLTHLLQMTDPTHPAASAFYFKIFNSMGLPHQIPFPDTDETNFIDHLLLYLKNLIIQCQECQAGFQFEKLMVYETLVKACVSYSPLSLQNMSSKVILYGSIIKHATTVISFSFSKDSEYKYNGSFDRFVDEVVESGFVGHILPCDKKSIKGPWEAYSEYMTRMTLLKDIVSYEPLRYMCSNIILHKVITKVMSIVPSLSSSDTAEVEDDTGKEENLVLQSHFLSNLTDKYEKFMEDVEEINDLQIGMKYKVIGEQGIEQYINGLEEVQKQYLSSNKQAIISVQNLRSFRHLIKVIVNCFRNEDLLNDHQSQVLVAVEHTTILLCSCWIEPEKNQELKLTRLLHMTSIKNAKVQSIIVQGFKTLEQSVCSPWPNELAEANFIDHMLLYLKELTQCQTRSLVASLKEQLENLQSYLTVLRNTVEVKHMDASSRYQSIIPNRMRAFHSLVINSVITMATISVIDSEDAEKENISLLRDLEENISLMKREIRKSIIIFDYPAIGGESFSIFKNLEETLTFRTDVISPMKHQLNMVYSDLLKLRSFLDKPIENKEQGEDLRQCIFQVSHKADFIIQSYVMRDGPTYYYSLQLSVVMEDIQLLITEMEGHDTDTSTYVIAEETYKQGSSEGSTPNITDIVVGFEDESEAILENLIGRSESRNIIAIVGMPGLGKTTIAKKVYNHPYVANHFDRRAWCCVSQSYQKKELLLQILRSITEVNDDRILEKNDDEIAAMLSKRLKKCRYLIVLDDVWETKAWEDLKKSFPDDKNQSRVIITSRDRQVAQTLIQATPYNYVHSLRVFHDSESYKLLQHKLFSQDRFPTELCDAGMIIARKCMGLPLAVVLAAGILSRMEKTKGHWIKFGQSLSAQIVNEAGNQCKALIELSYTHLPDHLKCCFLYFGAFPEAKKISARKLTWLWIAEGFVRDANPKRLEDIGEHYLMDLIGRSLVIGSKSVSRPGIKSCHVHDLLRDFCLVKAEEENFLQVVRGYNKYLPPDTGQFDNGVDPEDPQDRSNVTHLQYRLSIYSKRKHFIKAKPSGPNVRTLFFRALADMHPNRPYDASFISRYFKLIEVLDLGSINIGDSLTEVALMLHLRYLAVKGDIESVPTTIENLWNLETFILRGLGVALISVPNSILNLLRLRHLHIEDRISINLYSEGIVNSTILADMESFSTPTISYGDNVEKLLRRLPNLRKLKCIFLDSWDYYEKCNWFPVLEFLTQLVSLKVSWNYKSFRSSQWPCRFSFPTNLGKLTLSEFGLPWSEISAIGKLPNLNSLKLLSRAFTGKRWDMSEGDFLALKFLKLESLDIKVWTATNEHIPCLQRLMLSKCERLKEIPSEIGDIETLEIIEVRWCSPSAAASARSIQETAEEYGNYTLKVHIYPNEGDLDASSKEDFLSAEEDFLSDESS